MTYLIIGASAGVGRALAARFASAGHDLILVASDERDLLAIAADLTIRHGVKIRTVAADVGQDDAYLDRVAAVLEEMGGIDGMLFPIGASVEADDTSFAPDRLAWLTRVNYQSIVTATTRFLPVLLSRGRTCVVGFGSVAASRGRRRNVAYSGAKRALQSFFESLRHSCSGSQVRVQFYVLGFMDTELAWGLRSVVPKGNPETLSAEVLRNLSRDRGVAYYPPFWRVVCFALALMPWWVFRRVRF